MRIVLTADLHYDIARSQEPTRQVAEQIGRTGADALIILGDIAGRDLSVARDCLALFDGFKGRKFFVAGNHDIWTDPGGDSLRRFELELPAVCRDTGFHPLDIEPAEIDGVAIVGSMGWYDYTLLPRSPASRCDSTRRRLRRVRPIASAGTRRCSHRAKTSRTGPWKSGRAGWTASTCGCR